MESLSPAPGRSQSHVAGSDLANLSLVDEHFETDELDAAEAVVRRVYPRAELHESRSRFRHEQATRGSDEVSFTRFKFESEMQIEVDFENVAPFGLVLGGQYAGFSGDTALNTSAPFVFAPGRGGSRSRQLDLLMVNIDFEALATHGTEGSGGERSTVTFHGTSPVSEPMSRYWSRTLGYAWRSVVQVDDLFRNDLVRVATFETVMTAALAAFPIEVSGPRGLPPIESHPAGVRRARLFIDENPAAPLTVAAIAQAAETSVRALQNGFRRELGMTPTAYLRVVRLHEARRSLLDANPEHTTVSDTANLWGFSNVGRFSNTYRRLFGEYPAETLRR